MAQIVIADDSPSEQYTVGSTPTTGPYSITFPYFSTADIKVYVDGTLQTLTTHYTIAGTAVDNGFSSGSVTFVSNISSVTVTIDRDVAIERTTNFPLAGVFNVGTLNTVLNKLFAIGQQLETTIGLRLFRKTTSTETYSMEWPDGATSIAQIITVDTANGLVLAATDSTASGISATAAATSATAAAASATTAAAAVTTALAAKITISTSAPSGGNAGDIWYRVTV